MQGAQSTVLASHQDGSLPPTLVAFTGCESILRALQTSAKSTAHSKPVGSQCCHVTRLQIGAKGGSAVMARFTLLRARDNGTNENQICVLEAGGSGGEDSSSYGGYTKRTTRKAKLRNLEAIFVVHSLGQKFLGHTIAVIFHSYQTLAASWLGMCREQETRRLSVSMTPKVAGSNPASAPPFNPCHPSSLHRSAAEPPRGWKIRAIASSRNFCPNQALPVLRT